MGYRDDYFKENKSNHGWYTCRRCGKKVRKSGLDVDHILPRNYGGGDGLDNLQGLCAHCNRSKKDSLKNTASDYIGHNTDRAKKKIFDFLGLD